MTTLRDILRDLALEVLDKCKADENTVTWDDDEIDELIDNAIETIKERIVG